MAGHSVTVKIDGDTRDFEKTLKNLGNVTKAGLADIKAGIDLTSAAAKSLFNIASGGVKYTAGIEQLQTSFEVMTGSAEKAAEVVERLRVMGAETPFETADLASTTQLLMQYGFTADDAIDKMRMLGDVAQGNKDAMISIATGYAQMSSAGKVNLQDIKQMINGGFNPLQEISERTGESMDSLYDRVSKGKLSIDEITKSLQAATSEGGKFYQSMDKQSQTLNGQLSSLKDNADQLLGSLTQGLSDELRDSLLPLANNMISALQEGFDARGMQGLLDAATGMLPDLLNMMTGKMEDSIASLQKFAPKAIKSIMGTLPTAIRGANAVLPQVTAALFEVAGLVVQELVGMLPELIPMVVEGFANLLGGAIYGIDQLISGFFSGIEQAVHQGQTKIAGVWVDTEEIAKYDFKIDMTVDPSNAYQKIEDAYDSLRNALKTDLLTESQKSEILGMIGEDYDAIYEKLKSFGLSDDVAASIATEVTNVSAELTNELSKLNLSVPTSTVIEWYREANGSRLHLIAAAKKAGLSESDINQITAVYDGMMGRMKANTPSIVQEIYDKLTDGKPDDKKTVEGLKTEIETYISELLAGLDEAYQTKLSELDTTASDYEARKAELDEWYASSKKGITDMDKEMRSLVNSLANAPASVVQARMNEFAEIDAWLLQKESEIDALTEKAKNAGEAAFQVVRSGAKTDEQTIETAISFKASTFKVDVQAAEDAYNAAKEELNEKLANKEISVRMYNIRSEKLEAEKQAAIEKATATYESALGEIMAGVAESEGNLAAIESSGARAQAIQMINGVIEEIGSVGWENVSEDKKKSLSSTLTNLLGDGFDVSQLDMGAPGAVLQNAIGMLMDGIDTSALEGKVGEVFGAALESGVLAGTSFDTTNATSQVAAIYGTVATSAATSAAPQLQTAGETAVGTAVDAMDDYEGAKTSGSHTLSGLLAGLSGSIDALFAAGAAAGAAFTAGYNSQMQIQSPSRVMMQAGRFTGQGLEIGLRESIEKAVAVADGIMGGLTNGAYFRRVSFVGNMPDIRQEVALANEQQPVNLYVNGKQLGEVMSADTSRAQSAYNRSIALGVGK